MIRGISDTEPINLGGHSVISKSRRNMHFYVCIYVGKQDCADHIVAYHLTHVTMYKEGKVGQHVAYHHVMQSVWLRTMNVVYAS